MTRIGFLLIVLAVDSAIAGAPTVGGRTQEFKEVYSAYMKDTKIREFACGQSSNGWFPIFKKVSADIWLSRSENCAPLYIAGKSVVYKAYHKYLSDFSTGQEIIIDPTYIQWFKDAGKPGEYVDYNNFPGAFIGTRRQLVLFFIRYRDIIAVPSYDKPYSGTVDDVEAWVNKTYSLGPLNIYRSQYNSDVHNNNDGFLFRQKSKVRSQNCGYEPQEVNTSGLGGK